ncbi:Serine/threonine-protein kinase haspin, partial [Coemansia helicoidea]
LFAVFVLEMGGETLENADVATWKEARSIIRQLALSMALAERNNRFEHRDLHWGNIMVTRYPSNLTFLYQLPPSGTRVKSTLISIPSYRLRCTIIDYTLSRLHIDNDAQDAAGARPAGYDAANNVFYVALKDEALFRGEGDIQYDVYRQMRAAAADRWEGFHPHTNVLWLVYVLQKILTTKAPAIRDELVAFAESKLGAAFDAAPPELRRAACQELLRRWMREFEQCESSSHVLRCALLDLYKG